MSTINIDLAADTILNVMIGQQDENEVREVVFDYSGWYTTYGSGTISLAIQRPKDEWPYEGTLTVDSTNHKATWEISETDTAYAGTGQIQLSYKVGDAKKKSVVYRFTCHKSLGALGSVVTPVQIQTFIDEVEEALQTMDGKLDDMEDEITDVKQDLGEFKYSQTKTARYMDVNVNISSGDVIYFKPITWSGDSFNQIIIQNISDGSYTTLVRVYALNSEAFFVASDDYTSFRVSVGTASVPSTQQTFEFILCDITKLNNLSSYVLTNRYNIDNNTFKYHGYLSSTANLNTITQQGWWLLAKAYIPTTTGLPSDIAEDASLQVYTGSLTVQILKELSAPYREYQRYLYNNNQSQSVWITTRPRIRKKTMYIFGDSLAKGALGTGGNGTSYLEIAAQKNGYDVVNCGVGGIGYVYSGKKLVSEVPWNTGEGRIRAQDVIDHYASELVNADTVILAYGVNDWQTLGDPNVTIAEADRRATSENIIANVKTAIYTIMTAHIGARIIVVTPINTSYRGGSTASGWGLETSLNNNDDGREAMTLEKTYQAIVDACNYYGVEYVDMTHNNATVNYLNINNVLPDHLHPSQTTYNRLADSIRFD